MPASIDVRIIASTTNPPKQEVLIALQKLEPNNIDPIVSHPSQSPIEIHFPKMPMDNISGVLEESSGSK